MNNGHTPATKADIERLEHKLDQAIEQLRAESSHSYNDLIERFTDTETRLLKAFYAFCRDQPETSQPA